MVPLGSNLCAVFGCFFLLSVSLGHPPSSSRAPNPRQSPFSLSLFISFNFGVGSICRLSDLWSPNGTRFTNGNVMVTWTVSVFVFFFPLTMTDWENSKIWFNIKCAAIGDFTNIYNAIIKYVRCCHMRQFTVDSWRRFCHQYGDNLVSNSATTTTTFNGFGFNFVICTFSAIARLLDCVRTMGNGNIMHQFGIWTAWATTRINLSARNKRNASEQQEKKGRKNKLENKSFEVRAKHYDIHIRFNQFG